MPDEQYPKIVIRRRAKHPRYAYRIVRLWMNWNGDTEPYGRQSPRSFWTHGGAQRAAARELRRAARELYHEVDQ